MDDKRPFFEGPFDSDEAADAVAELEESDDIAAAMTEVLDEFVRDNEDYAEEGQVEAALAVACLIAARISGIAPDEVAHHWLDRNPFTVIDDLRRLAAAAFDLATRFDDNHLSEVRAAHWPVFLEHLEPYRKALHGEPQEPAAPFRRGPLPTPGSAGSWCSGASPTRVCRTTAPTPMSRNALSGPSTRPRTGALGGVRPACRSCSSSGNSCRAPAASAFSRPHHSRGLDRLRPLP